MSGFTLHAPLVAVIAEAIEEDWREQALCAQTDPEEFFPEKGGSPRRAKRICQGCEVKTACLDYAMEHHIGWGVWGGLTEKERKRLATARRATTAHPVTKAA